MAATATASAVPLRQQHGNPLHPPGDRAPASTKAHPGSHPGASHASPAAPPTSSAPMLQPRSLSRFQEPSPASLHSTSVSSAASSYSTLQSHFDLDSMPPGIAATADALLDALGHEVIHDHPYQDHHHQYQRQHQDPHPQSTHDSSKVPWSAVLGQQLPTPRSSVSGASSSLSQPDNHSSKIPLVAPGLHQGHLRTPNASSPSSSTGMMASHASPSDYGNAQSTLASSSTSSSSSFSPLPHHHPHHHGPPLQYGVSTTSTTAKSPLSQNHLSPAHHHPGFRSSSPSSGPTPSLTQSMAGLGSGILHGAGGGASTSTPLSTLTERSPSQAVHFDQEFPPPDHHHHQHRQNQHQHPLRSSSQELMFDHNKESARELQRDEEKKNARSTLNGLPSFLPPALNQSLGKVVQSAKAAVASSSSSPLNGAARNKMSTLPTSRLGSSMDDLVGGSSSTLSTTDSTHWMAVAGRLYKATKLPLICLAWYFSSAVTNNIGKQILNQFRYPVTLTFIQFVFVSVFCLLGSRPLPLVGWVMTGPLKRPTRAIVQITGPLVVFQVIGHVFSSVAISRVPLSVVHTIKALTPLFTVLFYRIMLGTTYSRAVYLSLVPLTAGVMLACRLSLEFNNMLGLSCALISTLVFVTQNVFTKTILGNGSSKSPASGSKGALSHDHVGMSDLSNQGNENSNKDPAEEQLGVTPAQKLDKINILFYSSTLAALLMVPLWLYSEGWGLMFGAVVSGHFDSETTATTTTASFWTVSWLLFLNGISHFFQNLFAFSVLALTSPVTYSIASLIKRIVVIVASIVYFHQTLGPTQWTGVCLTFWGLWMYNSAKNAAKVVPGGGILGHAHGHGHGGSSSGGAGGRRVSLAFGGVGVGNSSGVEGMSLGGGGVGGGSGRNHRESNGLEDGGVGSQRLSKGLSFMV